MISRGSSAEVLGDVCKFWSVAVLASVGVEMQLNIVRDFDLFQD